MAFARFGLDSDVYVYDDARGGFTCDRCALSPTCQPYRFETAAEMVTHLLEHRAQGHHVPEDAIERLRACADATE